MLSIIFLYEKEGTGFWVLGTGSLKRQLFHASLCPSGHGCLYEKVASKVPQQSPRGGVMEQTNWAV